MNPEIPPSSILEQELLKRNQQLEEKVSRLEKENQILRDLRRLDLIKKYGSGSESLSLELLELEPGVNDAEVEAEAQREPMPAAAKKERKHPGRQELPAHLERVEQIVPCTSEQCICGICGKEKGSGANFIACMFSSWREGFADFRPPGPMPKFPER